MAIEYTLKSKFLLTKDELEKLDYLRYKDGRMWPELKNKFKLGMVILAKECGQIISWGLIFEPFNCETRFFIYTKKSHRRLGIGREIYVQMLHNFGKHISVSRHNSVARKFYDSLGAPL